MKASREDLNEQLREKIVNVFTGRGVDTTRFKYSVLALRVRRINHLTERSFSRIA
jgi:hypothetical protein